MATKIKQVQRVVSAFVRRIEELIDALLENDALLQSAVMFKLRRLAGIDVVEVGKRRHDGIVELDQLRVFGNWLTAFAGELLGEGFCFFALSSLRRSAKNPLVSRKRRSTARVW